MRKLIVAFLAAILVTATPVSAAITYTQAIALAQDNTFIGQVLIAMEKAATSIMSETNTTAGHGQRVLLAQKVTIDPDYWKQKFAFACAGNLTATLSGLSATDAQVDTAVSTVWNTLAGYPANQ